jgi:16S rRNA G527 N7-methylase RsmG
MCHHNAEYDWSEAWAESLSQHGLRANLDRHGIASEKFWDSFNGWKEWQENNNYPGLLLERIMQFAKPGDKVLDIGAGSGAFAVPLAKVCRRVTAVEPSPGQINRLNENALREDVRNLTVLPKRWENVSLDEIEQHELVLAAYSFEMKDIKSALDKMCQAAKRYLFLIHTAGHDLMDILHEILGVMPGPDYIYLYNVLYQMGYRASVEIFTRKYRIPVKLQMQMFAVNPGLNEEQQQTLYKYMETHAYLVQRNGQTWVNRQHKDALIWLEKEG